MSDERSNFGLGSLANGINKRVDELAHDSNATVKSRDDIGRTDKGPMKPFTFQQEDYDRTESPKDSMRKYWRQYETTPILRNPISSFADQVTEPGYYIQARDLDEETLRELDHWLQKCSYIEGEPGKDFRLLAKKATIQREVRGTALIEKAPDKNDDEKIAALKLINPETMEAVTRPGQSILLSPDDIDEYEDVPQAESGGAAAYLQDLAETNTFFGRSIKGDRIGKTDKGKDWKVGFQRDEIIKLTRDADVGEIFGTSRIEAVSNRVEGIKKKLNDNDEAISGKAYPLWLFKFGSEDNPWDSEDINRFMKAHEMENFHPGMKQGVRGDVNVNTISGEVAEIAEYLQFDLDWIMSAMPMPKYALGAFESNVGQVGGIAQQQDVNRQIKEARREIEEEFSPLLREVAQQFGVDEDDADDIYLRIGSPGEPEPEVPRRENIIRYVPKDQRDPRSDGQTVSDGQTDGERQNVQDDHDVDNPLTEDIEGFDDQTDAPEEAGAQVWHTDMSVEQLSVRSTDIHSTLSDTIYNSLVSVRDNTLDQVGHEFGDTPVYAATNFERIANGTVRAEMSQNAFSSDLRPIVRETIESTKESLESHSDRSYASTNYRFYAQDITHSTEDAMEEMLRLMRTNVRRAVSENDSWDGIRQRVEDKYSNANLRQRADLIAHMELKKIEEATKLDEWNADTDVVGVRVSNENPSTPLTQSLSGVEVYFDDGDIGEQLMERTRTEYLKTGFNPLPQTPPFHYQDTTTYKPIRRQ